MAWKGLMDEPYNDHNLWSISPFYCLYLNILFNLENAIKSETCVFDILLLMWKFDIQTVSTLFYRKNLRRCLNARFTEWMSTTDTFKNMGINVDFLEYQFNLVKRALYHMAVIQPGGSEPDIKYKFEISQFLGKCFVHA
jgi:hypothetical protein